MTHDFKNDSTLGEEQIDDLLQDIELRCSADLSIARGMTAVRKKAGVTIRPGNASERDTLLAAGDTTEVKSQGVTCLTDHPIAVGNVFHLTFDRSALDIAPLLAVCNRCAMLSDVSFEANFKFVHEVHLPDATKR